MFLYEKYWFSQNFDRVIVPGTDAGDKDSGPIGCFSFSACVK